MNRTLNRPLALCGEHHNTDVSCIWCSRAAIDARYSALVDCLDELSRAAQGAAALVATLSNSTPTDASVQRIADALGTAFLTLENESDTISQLMIANELIPAEPAPGDCPCPVCSFMRANTATMLQEIDQQEAPTWD